MQVQGGEMHVSLRTKGDFMWLSTGVRAEAGEAHWATAFGTL